MILPSVQMTLSDTCSINSHRWSPHVLIVCRYSAGSTMLRLSISSHIWSPYAIIVCRYSAGSTILRHSRNGYSPVRTYTTCVDVVDFKPEALTRPCLWNLSILRWLWCTILGISSRCVFSPGYGTDSGRYLLWPT